MGLSDACFDFRSSITEREHDIYGGRAPNAWVRAQVSDLKERVSPYSQDPWDYPPVAITALIAACDATLEAWDAEERGTLPANAGNLHRVRLHMLTRLAEAIRELYDTALTSSSEGEPETPEKALERANFEAIRRVASILVELELTLADLRDRAAGLPALDGARRPTGDPEGGMQRL